MREIWDKIQLHTLASPPIKKPQVEPGASAVSESAVEQYQREQQQYQQWNRLIEYEKENHLHLDEASLRSRVRLTYKHALCYIRFFPEAWYAFARYEEVREPFG